MEIELATIEGCLDMIGVGFEELEFCISGKAYDGRRQHGITSMTDRVTDASGVKPLKAAEVEFHRFIGWRCLGIAG